MTDYPISVPSEGKELDWIVIRFENGTIHQTAHHGGWAITIKDARGNDMAAPGFQQKIPYLEIRYSPSGHQPGTTIQNDPSEFQLLWGTPYDNNGMGILKGIGEAFDNGVVPDLGDPGYVFPADRDVQKGVGESEGSGASSGGSDTGGGKPDGKPKETTEDDATPAEQGEDTPETTQPASNSLYVDYEVDPLTGDLVLSGPYRGFPIVMWLTGPGRGQLTSVSNEQADQFIRTGEMDIER